MRSRKQSGRCYRMISVMFCSILVSACVTTPEFDTLTGITPKTIADVIKCELIWARDDHPELAGRKNDPAHPPWLAVADLTLEVDEGATLTPSFTHTDVISKTVSHVFNWGVKLDTQSQRIYTQSITFRIDELNDERCKDRETLGGRGFSLNGNLGLSEIVRMALESAKYSPETGTFGPKAFAAGGGGGAGGGGTKYFGQSLQFAVTKNLNGMGPTWVLTFFKGPGGFFKAERGDTNKLLISFAPYSKKAPDKAEAAARYSNSMLQQNTLPSSILINQLQQKLE